MKTQIKKFLWFDITPRKHLYDELDECYRTISNNRKSELKHLETIDELINTINSKDKQIASMNDKINELNNTIKVLSDSIMCTESDNSSY